MNTVHDLEGKQVDEFKVEEKIYSTNFSVVYRAVDTSLGDRPVAIKFAKPDTNLERFVKDAIFLGRLSTNQHIVPVYNVVPKSTKGIDTAEYIYYVMKYIPGNLEKHIASKGRLGLREAFEITLAVCDALDFAHNHPKKIIHRDIKPSNILLDDNGHVYLCDFGLARFDDADATRTVGIAGTPAYLSPEQARGKDLDQRSDIYSLGVVIFEMLSGDIPFRKDSFESMLTAILTEKPPRLDTLDKKIPAEAADVVDRCLEKDPSARFDSVRGLLAAFQKALGQEAESNLKKTLAERPLHRLTREARTRRRIWWALAGFILMASASWILLLRPIELRISPESVTGFDLEISNYLWKLKKHYNRPGDRIKVLGILPGKRIIRVDAEGYESRNIETSVSLWDPAPLTIKLDPEVIGLKIETNPPGALFVNSFVSKQVIDREAVEISPSGLSIDARLSCGTYEFRLIAEGYHDAKIELEVNEDNIRWREIAGVIQDGWVISERSDSIVISMRPKEGFIRLLMDHSLQKDESSPVDSSPDFSACRIRISDDSGLDRIEAERLQADYFDDIDPEGNMIVPVAVRSLIVSLEGMEDVRIDFELSEDESKEIRIIFEKEKEYGFAIFKADLPCRDDSDGVRIKVVESGRSGKGGTPESLAGAGRITPFLPVKIETGQFVASFSAAGWYGEDAFEVEAGDTAIVRCDLIPVSADVQVIPGNYFCDAIFTRTGPLCADPPRKIAVPFPENRSMQKGNWRIDLLDEKGEVFYSEQIRIEKDGVLRLKVK